MSNGLPTIPREQEGRQSEGEADTKQQITITNEPIIAKRAGRRKINIEFIEDKSRRHITFSKRKAGIMKKAYELSTLTGTQVLLLVASETGHVYTFATPKLQPLITKPEGKNLIQACLNAPDNSQSPPQGGGGGGNAGGTRMTGYSQDNVGNLQSQGGNPSASNPNVQSGPGGVNSGQVNPSSGMPNNMGGMYGHPDPSNSNLSHHSMYDEKPKIPPFNSRGDGRPGEPGGPPISSIDIGNYGSSSSFNPQNPMMNPMRGMPPYSTVNLGPPRTSSPSSTSSSYSMGSPSGNQFSQPPYGSSNQYPGMQQSTGMYPPSFHSSSPSSSSPHLYSSSNQKPNVMGLSGVPLPSQHQISGDYKFLPNMSGSPMNTMNMGMNNMNNMNNMGNSGMDYSSYHR